MSDKDNVNEKLFVVIRAAGERFDEIDKRFTEMEKAIARSPKNKNSNTALARRLDDQTTSIDALMVLPDVVADFERRYNMLAQDLIRRLERTEKLYDALVEEFDRDMWRGTAMGHFAEQLRKEREAGTQGEKPL